MFFLGCLGGGGGGGGGLFDIIWCPPTQTCLPCKFAYNAGLACAQCKNLPPISFSLNRTSFSNKNGVEGVSLCIATNQKKKEKRTTQKVTKKEQI
jgi:hypothetical protein